MAKTRVLRSTIDPDFCIEIGTSSTLVNSCPILKGVRDNIADNAEIPVNMSKKHLKKFIDFHNHFSSVEAEKDLEWTNAFFRELSDDEFKELTAAADFLDSQRFIEASGDFVMAKIDELDVAGIKLYLNIKDDFTAEQHRTMEERPLEFFSGIDFGLSDNANAAGAKESSANNNTTAAASDDSTASDESE